MRVRARERELTPSPSSLSRPLGPLPLTRPPADHKGANFLLHLERVVGGVDVFNPYQKDYISTFAGKAISTQDWEEHFWAYWGRYPEKERALREQVDFEVRHTHSLALSSSRRA